jgi:hypothetical protein
MENLLLGCNAIGNKWVFKVKAKSDGSVDHFKAWMVAHGFSQREGVDYSEMFPLVVKLSTMCTVLAIAAKRNMHMQSSADIETAFLNADLQDRI